MRTPCRQIQCPTPKVQVRYRVIGLLLLTLPPPLNGRRREETNFLPHSHHASTLVFTDALSFHLHESNCHVLQQSFSFIDFLLLSTCSFFLPWLNFPHAFPINERLFILTQMLNVLLLAIMAQAKSLHYILTLALQCPIVQGVTKSRLVLQPKHLEVQPCLV